MEDKDLKTKCSEGNMFCKLLLIIDKDLFSGGMRGHIVFILLSWLHSHSVTASNMHLT